jgi:hypothetical protein
VASAPPTPLPSPESLLTARTWQGVVYRPLDASARTLARALFTYVAAWVPPTVPTELGWGAWTSEGGAEKLVGALLLERHGTVGMLHGPVVVDQPDPFEVASQLVAATLPQVTALGVERCFTRPQGLDRVWVRFGFIPVPEAELPEFFKGCPGAGLFAWRGGSALWSARRTGELEESR